MALSSTANDGASKHVALVFDDGPIPAQAPKLLEIFAAEGIHVTFAQNAGKVLAHTETTLAQQAAGHEIVNHSYNHLPIGKIDEVELTHDIADAQVALTEILGHAPRWYWPPYLAVDERVRRIVTDAGFLVYPTPHLVSSEDWNTEVNADEIYRRATTGVEDASVILFHEWREDTAEQLPAILAELRRQGCVFLTFSELADYAKTLPEEGASGAASYGQP